jgi:hypothetical protein
MGYIDGFYSCGSLLFWFCAGACAQLEWPPIRSHAFQQCKCIGSSYVCPEYVDVTLLEYQHQQGLHQHAAHILALMSALHQLAVCVLLSSASSSSSAGCCWCSAGCVLADECTTGVSGVPAMHSVAAAASAVPSYQPSLRAATAAAAAAAG